MQKPMGAGQEVVTQESLLHAAAERIGKIRQGRTALHLHLSKLRPQNREDAHVRIALRMFELAMDSYRGQLFLLSNSDIVLLVKDARAADLDAIIYKLRALFSNDPLTFTRGEDGSDPFYTFYDLEVDYDSFLGMTVQLAQGVKKLMADQREQQRRVPLDAKSLSTLLDRIGTTDIAGIVRRQSAVGITDRSGGEKSTAEVMFQEFYVSISDLQRVLAPDINIVSNRWLFQHFSQVLDQRILGLLQDMSLTQLPKTFALNLNLATLATPAFAAFERAISGKATIVVEVQIVDIFADLNAFFKARDSLRASGHTILIDNISPVTLQFVDMATYDADFYKISWSPELGDLDQTSKLEDTFKQLGVDRIIMARCDSETAIHWGLALGVRKFQGRFLDAMLAAITMGGCDKSAACTLPQCIQRRTVIAGHHRGECGNLNMLDAFPKMVAPQRSGSR